MAVPPSPPSKDPSNEWEYSWGESREWVRCSSQKRSSPDWGQSQPMIQPNSMAPKTIGLDQAGFSLGDRAWTDYDHLKREALKNEGRRDFLEMAKRTKHTAYAFFLTKLKVSQSCGTVPPSRSVAFWVRSCEYMQR